VEIIWKSDHSGVQFEMEWSGRVRIPAQLDAVVVSETLPEKGQLQLNRMDQAINLLEHDPENAHNLWRNRKDLQGEVKISSCKQWLTFEVEVQDDIRDWESEEIEKRDRVEIALRSPEASGYWIVKISGQHDSTESTETVITPYETAPAVDPEAVTSTILAQDDTLIYRIQVKRADFGFQELITPQVFNVAIWDADGRGVGGWLEAAPGFCALKEMTHQKEPPWITAIPEVDPERGLRE
jgi:hypothetical protein